MPAGQLPPFFVLQTVGSLAEANRKITIVFFSFNNQLVSARGMVHQLRPLFSRVLPMMGMVKFENYRWVYTAVLYKFCVALIDFQANGDEKIRETFALQQYENDAFAAYEVFLTSAWVGSKELKVKRSNSHSSTLIVCLGSKYVCPSDWTSSLSFLCRKIQRTISTFNSKCARFLSEKPRSSHCQ